MALDCAEKLKPFGKSLEDATKYYLKFLRDAERSISVSTLVDEYLAGQDRLKRSQTHISDLRQRLGRFKKDFGNRPIRTLQANELEKWLHGLRLSAQSINNFRSRLSS